MRRTVLLLLPVLALVVPAGPAAAADPPEFERTLVREPEYTGTPRYFLLVFGQQGDTRIWCAFDGDVLYADLNGNGDLTEPGERIEKQPPEPGRPPRRADDRTFELPDVTEADGETTHRNLRLWIPTVRDIRDDRHPYVSITVDVKGDYRMYTSFMLDDSTRTPADAPFRHFHGPMTVFRLGGDGAKLVRGEKPAELAIAVGTIYEHPEDPGRAKTSWTFLDHGKGVPKDVHPIAEIAFPGATPEAEEVVVRIPLTQRC